MGKKHFAMVLIAPSLALSTVAKAQSVVVVDDLGGHHISLAEVNGRPAMAYERDQRLWYVRANDTKGTTWGNPSLVNPSNPWFTRPSLTVIDGHPAISAIDPNWEELVYVRATDPAGDAWGTPVTAAAGIWATTSTTLAIVNGFPAVCGATDFDGPLAYARATDSSGLGWNTPIHIADSVSLATSYSQVDGHPAYAYSERDPTHYARLRFVRALDVSGDAWSTPLSIDDISDVSSPSMAIVGGKPAIAYYDYYYGDLLFVRSVALDGSSWETPVVLVSDGNVGWGASLQVVAGIPLIAYRSASFDRIELIQAVDPEAESWFDPIIIDVAGADVGGFTFASVNSLPTLAYTDYINDDLGFVFDIEVKLFLDDFESGDTLAWSSTVP